MSESIKERIRGYALESGFSLAGFVKPGKAFSYSKFLQWISAGRQASMDYLARPDALLKRGDTSQVFGPDGTIIMLAYPIPSPLSDEYSSIQQGYGRVAAYAWGNDYHDVIPAKAQQLAEEISQWVGRTVKAKIYTDTGPILERDLAARAGLGWIGKNSCLINPHIGSFFLLACMHIDLEISEDEVMVTDYCGNCTRCIDACPTKCILPDRTIDAGKCVSYLTIENKDLITSDLFDRMESNVFGCDICQVVCPWNIRFASQAINREITPGEPTKTIDLVSLIRISPEEFNRQFKHSPIKRAKRRGMIRNAIATLANDSIFTPILMDLTNHDEELVRVSALQAIGRNQNEENSDRYNKPE